jgi:hypothetical protein
MYVKISEHHVPPASTERYLKLQAMACDAYTRAGCSQFLLVQSVERTDVWIQLAIFERMYFCELAEEIVEKTGLHLSEDFERLSIRQLVTTGESLFNGVGIPMVRRYCSSPADSAVPLGHHVAPQAGPETATTGVSAPAYSNGQSADEVFR